MRIFNVMFKLKKDRQTNSRIPRNQMVIFYLCQNMARRKSKKVDEKTSSTLMIFHHVA